ncbi:arylsulfatase [Agrococcus versicolor]|uniref:Arylsulfatase n=1 Tax=Agrococcus versicolor TaxID=501482 RepID=A0ABP5M8B0_9MICO
MTSDRTRPNILLITADEWPGRIAPGDERNAARIPTLDYLARLGTTYTRAYSECPVCIPARRSLLTGTSPRVHGDRTFQPDADMPDAPTLPAVLRDHGYQCFAVGKLHVYPQRDRVGFDDVLLSEEGRSTLGATDDYEAFLADEGHPGRQFTHGMSNNDYQVRPWHLPEHTHPTSWAATEMARMIRRRDPKRPAFWYLSFQAPHPPLVPPAAFLDMYDRADIDAPIRGDWVDDRLPFALRQVMDQWPMGDERDVAEARRGVYALCTQIDYALRVVLGTLREEGVLDDTIIVFTSDHGDMLGDHDLWAKRLFYESSARIPMLIVGTDGDDRIGVGSIDSRLLGLQDVMPTILELAGVPVPATSDGTSAVGVERRSHLYGEFGESANATRMVTDDRHKLVYYPAGNRLQLFDLVEDPGELVDLSDVQEHADTLGALRALLISELYGTDLAWLEDGQLVGMPDPGGVGSVDRGLHGVRGLHWPPPPITAHPGRVVGAPGEH